MSDFIDKIISTVRQYGESTLDRTINDDERESVKLEVEKIILEFHDFLHRNQSLEVENIELKREVARLDKMLDEQRIKDNECDI